MSKLRIILLSTLVTACAPSTSSKGQLITCSTDPNSGVILACQPAGSGSGSGGANTCQDVDEDGDGEPHDSTDDNVARTADGGGSDSASDDHDHDGIPDAQDDDDDNDGVPDDQDCDEQTGQDLDQADLPYDIRMSQDQVVTPIKDAFAEEGAQPQAILSVEMDGGGTGWRLAELQAAATFTVTAADCAHVGNRDVGRDRVIVTWRTASGAVESDHLDLRYCD